MALEFEFYLQSHIVEGAISGTPDSGQFQEHFQVWIGMKFFWLNHQPKRLTSALENIWFFDSSRPRLMGIAVFRAVSHAKIMNKI